MSGDNGIDRRQLLKTIAVGGAMVRWPALAAASTAADNAKHTYAVFSAAQAALMDALVEVLIPADDFPGAKDAGVVGFIDQKLGGPYGTFFIARYEAGLRKVDEISRQRFHQDFALLDGSQQSTLLHAFADNTHGSEVRDFFQTVLSDTFEGYYGSPEDGGNRNGASWKMIGFRG